MFGAIRPKTSECTKEQRKEYKKYYCGLCFSLGEEFGNFSRLLLNFDLTNELVLVAADSSFPRVEKKDVCPWSIKRKKVTYIQLDGVSCYLAKLTYLFAYYKMVDDVEDGGSFKARLAASRMGKNLKVIEGELVREKMILQSYLQQLHTVEKECKKVAVFDVASLFGEALKQTIIIEGMNPLEREILSQINYWMGVWVYTMDAITDCMVDGMKKQYNPILAGYDDPPVIVIRQRREELINILKACRKNLNDLSDLYATGEQRELLHGLFNQKLSGLTQTILGVEKNVLEA